MLTIPAPESRPLSRSASRSWAMLLLLAAVFVLPFAVGSGLFWSGWHPGSLRIHGELIQPPRPLPPTGLHRPDGISMPTGMLHGKWLLVMPAADACNSPSCQQTLQQLQQVHLALGKEQSRVQRVLIGKEAPLLAETEMQQRFPGLVIAAAGGREETVWNQTLDGFKPAVFVVDPFGNLMMRYTDLADMRGILKDVERLLKHSWVR